MLTRARAGVGVFRTVFYLPALVPPVAATLGFVYLLNPATGPINTLLAKLGVEGPLWFNDPSWSKPSLAMLSLWGIGNTMIIFLAAVLDVPKHLYESADLDGAGALPAPALGDPADDQPGAPLRGRARRHPGAAVLHAGVRGGERRRRAGVTGRRGEHARARLPGGLDALLSDPPLLPRLPLLQHGLRLRDGRAAPGRRVRRDEHRSSAALGARCTTRGRRGECHKRRRSRQRHSPCAASPRARSAGALARRDRRPQPAHRRRDRLPRARSCSSG